MLQAKAEPIIRWALQLVVHSVLQQLAQIQFTYFKKPRSLMLNRDCVTGVFAAMYFGQQIFC